MNFVQAFIMAVVEGITEFLPISSTAHMVITARLVGLTQTHFVEFFEVFIQMGAIMAIIVLYIKKLLKNWNLIWLLAASFIPTAIIGLLAHGIFKDYLLNNLTVIAWALIIVGVVFIIVENFYGNNKKQITKLSYKEAIFIGFIQALAIIPGVSRSGAVILGMLIMGFRRDQAAEYSFMLGLPTLSAAAFYDAYKIQAWNLPLADLKILLFASIVAFIFALFAVKWFLQYLKHNSLKGFGFYRIFVGLIILGFLV